MPYAGRFGPAGIVMPAETARDGEDYHPGEVTTYRLSEEELAAYRGARPVKREKPPISLSMRRKAKAAATVIDEDGCPVTVKSDECDEDVEPVVDGLTVEETADVYDGPDGAGDGDEGMEGMRRWTNEEEVPAVVVAALQNMAAEAGQEVREIIAKAQERHQELRSGAVQPVPLEEVEASAITGTLARFVAPEEAAARAAEYAEQRSRGVEMAGRIFDYNDTLLWDRGDGKLRPLYEAVKDFFDGLDDAWLGQDIIFRIGPAE